MLAIGQAYFFTDYIGIIPNKELTFEIFLLSFEISTQSKLEQEN